ncbi:unnamed protein product [Gongylonema pulchrum]|uniref:GINS complex subunit 4 n=1 Tax=Gongylonema pulchrum TaxID=637853 RepID=A0A183E3T9_9BILA|nr:unnamed protein product [Gongylonema pulchrum]
MFIFSVLLSRSSHSLMNDRRDGGEEENKENEPALTGAPSDADLPQCEAGDEGGSSVEDGDLEITPEQLSEQLFQAWQNELHAPRLLPHKEYTVDLMIELLEAMEDNFNNCEDKRALKVTLHKVEVMRLSYVVHDYIRKRLRKVSFDFLRLSLSSEYLISKLVSDIALESLILLKYTSSRPVLS